MHRVLFVLMKSELSRAWGHQILSLIIGKMQSQPSSVTACWPVEHKCANPTERKKSFTGDVSGWSGQAFSVCVAMFVRTSAAVPPSKVRVAPVGLWSWTSGNRFEYDKSNVCTDFPPRTEAKPREQINDKSKKSLLCCTATARHLSGGPSSKDSGLARQSN